MALDLSRDLADSPARRAYRTQAGVFHRGCRFRVRRVHLSASRPPPPAPGSGSFATLSTRSRIDSELRSRKRVGFLNHVDTAARPWHVVTESAHELPAQLRSMIRPVASS